MKLTTLPSVAANLIGSINRREEEIRYHVQSMLCLAKEQGEDFIKLREWAKDQSGGFREALAQTTVSRAQAYRYIYVAENWGAVSHARDTSIRGFLALTARRRKEEAQNATGDRRPEQLHARNDAKVVKSLDAIDPAEYAVTAAEVLPCPVLSNLPAMQIPPHLQPAIDALHAIEALCDRSIIRCWIDLNWEPAIHHKQGNGPGQTPARD